jgi:hypothetical protein
MLATLARQPAGYPFGSLVSYALDERGQPLFFLSALAEHTAHLAHDPRASLLICELPPAQAASGGRSDADPLARGRVTLLGRVALVPDEQRATAEERFLARHPEAAAYSQLPDFAFYRLEVESVRYVGGFGRMSWIEPDEYASAQG